MLIENIKDRVDRIMLPPQYSRTLPFTRRRFALLRVNAEMAAIRKDPSLRSQEERLAACVVTLRRLLEDETKAPTSAPLRRMIEASLLLVDLRQLASKTRNCPPERLQALRVEIKSMREQVTHLLRGRNLGAN